MERGWNFGSSPNYGAMTTQELDFLRESNNIEDEWDDLSLQDAVLAWEFIKKCNELTPDCILQIHKILMKNRSTIPDHEKGAFRNDRVWVGTHEGRPWYAVPVLIEEWCRKANATVLAGNGQNKRSRKDIEFDIEYRIREDHVAYEGIHPFFDGNGRSGRILLNWQMQMVGLPILVIKEDEKQEYYKWFK